MFTSLLFHKFEWKNRVTIHDLVRYLSTPIQKHVQIPVPIFSRQLLPFNHRGKTTGLAENATTAEKFHWLKIEKEIWTITPLTFGSLDSAGEVEERCFEEGFLKFNFTLGTFIEKYNSAQHPLTIQNPLELSEEIKRIIEIYFSIRENSAF